MPSGWRLEHAQYVTSVKIYFRPRLTAVASRILKSLRTAERQVESSRAHARLSKFTSGSRPSSSRRPILGPDYMSRTGPGSRAASVC